MNRNNKKHPPAIARWLLQTVMPSHSIHHGLGDYEELFHRVSDETNPMHAHLWYWKQIVISFLPLVSNAIYWRIAMLFNYFKIALRNVKKQTLYSFITLSGLSMGLAVFILFVLINAYFKNYNSCHENMDRIYSVVQTMPGGQEGDLKSAIVAGPLLPSMQSEFPEIENGSRFLPAGQMIVKYRDKIFFENQIRLVDDSFLSIFSFPMIKGDKNAALSKRYSVVMTEEMALKYFGDENPIGQSLTLNNEFDVMVTGITENNPLNSSIRYDFLVSMETAEALFDTQDDWKTYNQAAFLLLPQGFNSAQLEDKLGAFVSRHYSASEDSPTGMFLHSMHDFFLNSSDIDCLWGTGSASFIVLWIISILILTIASINFVNLSTARYTTRAKEVGLRKVIGANRFQLIRQFLSETMLMAFIALPIALLMYIMLEPLFETFMGNIFSISLWEHPDIIALVIGITLLTGLFSGLYPAFYLSAFKPIKTLKGDTQKGKKGSGISKLLVVVQFIFSIILILMTFISIRQAKHNVNVDLGFQRERIIAVSISDNARVNLDVLKKEMSRHTDIQAVSASRALPIAWETEDQVLPEGAGKEAALKMNVYGIDHGFIEMMDIQMLQGRGFSKSFIETGNFIINEKAVTALQWENPLGKNITVGEKKGTVIGVAKDFHFKSILFTTLSPAVLYFEPGNLNYLLFKYSSPASKDEVSAFLEQQWKTLIPDQPFEQVTLDEQFETVYIESDKTSEFTSVLGIMAILLSCMGLLGLSSFSVERRIKEIGIRKVLGASVTGVVGMLVKSFLKLVVIANLIAMPITYLLSAQMNRFFYAYPADIGVGIFIFTLIASFIVAFLAVMSQTLKAAHSNPVDALKYE